MAIKIGNNTTVFKVGSSDCSIYLGDVKLYPTGSHDYSQDYFTMNITTGGDIVWSGSTAANTLSYSKDNGDTWTTANSATTISVTAGDKVLWKGTPTPSSDGIGWFSGDTNVRYSVEGNTMSLLYGDNFKEQTSLSGKNYCFRRLLYNNTNVISAENLVLPATTLATSCYPYMFGNCTSLTTAPELPATTLANSCYQYMFYGCTSLTTAPELPATTLANSCYDSMFYGCTSLTTAPSVLPATTLANSCYQYMFRGCTSLTTAPSVLPATTLAQSCYESMFQGCTSLTTAPELPATTLENRCYMAMFSGCRSLNYIKCLATNITASNCTLVWVNNVPSSGTFVKAASMTGWTTGSDGIPNGWTVQDNADYFTIVSESDDNTISIKKTGQLVVTVSASTDNGQTWAEFSYGTIATLNTGNKLLLKGVNDRWSSGSSVYNSFISTSAFHVEGNVMSLLYGDNFVNQTSLEGKTYAFYGLFSGNTNVTSAENLVLPATTLANYCYNRMFSNCTSLTTAPELPALNLAWDCYYYMFGNCTSLTTAPELPATTLKYGCYNYMFYGCISLNYIKCLATDITASNCTNYWVYGVAATGTFVKDASMTDWTTGINGIPSGWTVEGDTHDYSLDYFTIVSEADNNTVSLVAESSAPSITVSASTDNGQTWTEYTGGTIATINTGDKVLLKGVNNTLTSSNGNNTIVATASFHVEGNTMSLLFGDNFSGQTSLSSRNYALAYLFKGVTTLTSAENMILPATTLAERCYTNMFEGCTSLTTAPELPATTLTKDCYNWMFNGCTSLTTAPSVLPATSLASFCYSAMFSGCTSLTTAPVLPATSLVDNCYRKMFKDCSSLNYIKCLARQYNANSYTLEWVSNVAASGTFVKDPNMSSWGTGISGIPSGWTVQNA